MRARSAFATILAGIGAAVVLAPACVLTDHEDGIAIDVALAQFLLDAGRPVVGVMGGSRTVAADPNFGRVVRLTAELTRRGYLVVGGGGLGIMEAANLGAYLADYPAETLTTVIDQLAKAPDFRDHDAYTAAALEVRAQHPATADLGRGGGLAIPTWLYGHEPANLFAAQIAKYFSNAIREDTILRISRGGIVFAPGMAGTVQEVFQAATKTFYATDGASGPFVFLDTEHWTKRLPVRELLVPLLAASPAGDMSGLIHITDDLGEAAEILTT